MTTDIRDCPPGTVPPWVLRFAYDGEEWLALGEDSNSVGHTCDRHLIGTGYVIFTTETFEPCSRQPCAAIVANRTFSSGDFLFNGDSLPEAEAAFTRLEAEWRAAKPDGPYGAGVL